MAVYTVNGGEPVGEQWVTLPTPAADAWVQGRGDLLLTTADTPDTATALIVKAYTPFPVTSGSSGVKVRSATTVNTRVVMQDKA